MARFIFRPQGLESTPIATVKRAASGQGATVLKMVGKLMLLEMAPAKAAKFARGLQGWSYSADQKTTRIPERRPLERGKQTTVQA